MEDTVVSPLWTLSGRFVGGRQGNLLFNSRGANVGYFQRNVAYSNNGNYLGEMIPGYTDRIAKRQGIAHAQAGAQGASGSIGMASYGNQGGLGLGGWEDVDF
jgi:hypothetical protein